MNKKSKILGSIAGLFCSGIFSGQAKAELKVGDLAPLFTLKNQDGKNIDLASRKDKGWTVIFFYPKAGTPGCTKQVCAFRDSVKVIRNQDAEIYGISADSVPAQAKFHKNHKLQFDLLADDKTEVINKFGVKMFGIDMAKRWTFVIDPQLKVRWINDNVDPVMDAQQVSAKLTELQKKKA